MTDIAEEPDLAEPDMSELASQGSPENFGTLMSHLAGAVFRCQNDSGWSMLQLSGGVHQLTGFTAEELTRGESAYRSLIHADDRSKLDEAVGASIRGRSRYQVDYRVSCADGTVRWILEQGVGIFDPSDELVALEGILTDFTEHRRASELIETQEERLRLQDLAMDSCLNGVLITDFRQPDNPIIFANKAIEGITGYTKEDIYGKNCRFLQNGDRDQANLQELRSAVSEGRSCHVVLRNYRKDGTPFWNELSVSPIRDADGNVSHFLGVQADISERKQAEDARGDELVEIQQALRRNERLAALGQLAGGVAHELRSPLSVIQNAFIYLDETTEDPDLDTREALDEIRRGIAGAERIVAELLDYGRDSKPVHKDACSLSDVIGDALLNLRIPDAVQLDVQIGEPQPRCYCDRGQIGRLLHNLVRNAIQAMPDGGELTIVCLEQSEQAHVEVRDTGEGIREDDLEKIFQPLVTHKARGIGLGLAISKRYAEQNEGSLGVVSKVGEGSVFRLTLPAHVGQ